MATSSRLRGNRNPIFTIALVNEATGAAGAAGSYADDLKSYDLTPADKAGDDLTFYEAAAGVGKDWTLKVTTIVSYDEGSLYKFCAENAGEVEIVLGPWGNATPSTTQPHRVLRATLPGKPGISNEAGTDPVGADIELEFKGTSDAEFKTAL
ncbi:hypothetical protein ACQCX5_14400 [Propionibacteriaceae bacterium G57]|uniref:hypothetical protein n=1 Tax=Aestuariimicrobium sp. G57 TaxID=3418485 RepID=UPI003DA71FC2